MSLLSLVSAGNISFIATLLAVSYFKNVFAKTAIILAVALFIKFRFGFDPSNAVFLLMLFLGAVLQEELPFARALNIFISIIVSFVSLNAYLLLV